MRWQGREFQSRCAGRWGVWARPGCTWLFSVPHWTGPALCSCLSPFLQMPTVSSVGVTVVEWVCAGPRQWSLLCCTPTLLLPFQCPPHRSRGWGGGGEGHRSRHSPQAGSRCPHSHHSPLSSALRSRESTPGSSSAFSHWMPLGVRKARSQGVAPSLPAPQGESLAAALSLSGRCSPGQRPLPPRPHHLPLGTAAMAPVLCQRAPSMALYTTCLSGWEQAVGSALADLWVASPG